MKIKLQRQPTTTTELEAPDFNKNVNGFKHGCDYLNVTLFVMTTLRSELCLLFSCCRF